MNTVQKIAGGKPLPAFELKLSDLEECILPAYHAEFSVVSNQSAGLHARKRRSCQRSGSPEMQILATEGGESARPRPQPTHTTPDSFGPNRPVDAAVFLLQHGGQRSQCMVLR